MNASFPHGLQTFTNECPYGSHKNNDVYTMSQDQIKTIINSSRFVTLMYLHENAHTKMYIQTIYEFCFYEFKVSPMPHILCSGQENNMLDRIVTIYYSDKIPRRYVRKIWRVPLYMKMKHYYEKSSLQVNIKVTRGRNVRLCFFSKPQHETQMFRSSSCRYKIILLSTPAFKRLYNWIL